MNNLNRLVNEVEMLKKKNLELFIEYRYEYNELKNKYNISLEILRKEREED